jgi:hypothetical protein
MRSASPVSFTFKIATSCPLANHPYFLLLFRLQQLIPEGEEDGEDFMVQITVLPQIRRVVLDISGRQKTIWIRVVEEREYVDGELYGPQMPVYQSPRTGVNISQGLFY